MAIEHAAPRVLVYPDLEMLSAEAARAVTALTRRAVAARGVCTIALSGGATPRRLYELLAEEPSSAMPWDRLDLFWGDERCVPPDDPASNYGMARQALLTRVPVPPARVHRIPAEVEPPDQGAAAYERLLRERFGGTASDAFDIVLLGMGADGHTASLMPGDPALGQTERWAVAITAPASYSPRRRITLTLPLLSGARNVFFLVTGADKHPVVRAVLNSPEAAAERYPAARVRPAGGRLTWYLDAAAAGPSQA